jgi:hypothetical protein
VFSLTSPLIGLIEPETEANHFLKVHLSLPTTSVVEGSARLALFSYRRIRKLEFHLFDSANHLNFLYLWIGLVQNFAEFYKGRNSLSLNRSDEITFTEAKLFCPAPRRDLIDE